MKLYQAVTWTLIAGGALIVACATLESQKGYAAGLQGCILTAKLMTDAGRDERLAAYNKCADELDKDGGR